MSPTQASPASSNPNTGRSCKFCRVRKVKCNNAKPKCATCVRHDRPCVYALDPPRQSQRKAVEGVLIALKNGDAIAREKILDSIALGANETLQIPGYLLSAGSTNRYNGLSQEGNLRSDSITRPAPDGLRDFSSDEEYDPTTFLSRDECGTVGIFGPTSALHAQSPADDDRSNPRTAAEPDRYQLIAEAALQRQREHDLRNLPTIAGIPSELAMHLLDLHWNRQHHTFLLTYRPAFMRDLLRGGPYCSEFLLNAVFACSSKFSERLEVRDDPHRPETAGRRFFQRCDQLLAEQSLLTRSSIPTIAGLIMLGSTFNAWGQTSKGWLYTGFALRMVYDMGLHLDCREVAGTSAEDIEVRRRVFWAAFICDKLQSLYFGRPFTIQLRDARVSRDFMDTFEENELWSPYIDPQSAPSSAEQSPFPPTRIHSVSVFQQLCTLSKIMTSIIDRFYMVSATGPKARKYLSLIDHRLEVWCQQLPPELRFEPWVEDPNRPAHTIAAPNNIILLTTYNALVILLHRPFMGSPQSGSDSPDSWERCVTAARNITSLALAYRSAYSLRRANYMLSYAVCLDELAIPNCGVSAPARIIRRLMEANGMAVEHEGTFDVPNLLPADINLDFHTLPGLDFNMTDPESINQLAGFHDFPPDLDLLFGFMNDPDPTITGI
ncbi:hypothetical protein FE257_005443 [Aspergillus nanangensis]|uniref:Zn(2)-C6 fungal-type domain-containing protein n=1 Tax=Aspergillus nanangensis TaxID=2582783 RepID=A0AAD4CSF1_ASPNN|nr:hypothetical protein FE257_005443 [Aspergillus nanangensis]